jgi:hypothetical protein
MTTLLVKHSAHFGGFTAPLLRILQVLLYIAEAPKLYSLNLPSHLVITSGSEQVGRRLAHSKHYTFEAVDVRTNSFRDEDKDPFIATVRELLGGSYDILIRYRGTPGEHLHIEYDPD